VPLRTGVQNPQHRLEYLARRFVEFDARVWDSQIEADSRAGKLDALVEEARAEYEAGKTRPL
jgi:hypothetical protein